MNNIITEIKQRWNLPEEYLKFLENNVADKLVEKAEKDEFESEVRIYGSNDLIKNQEGYSFNPVTQKVIEVWPKDYVVIADSEADPYVLDLSKSNGKDAPVLFAYHGEGEWSFEEVASSFEEFLREKVTLR